MRVIETTSDSMETSLIEGIVKLFAESRGESLTVGTDVYKKLFKDHSCFLAVGETTGKFTLGTTAVFTVTVDDHSLRPDEGRISGESEVGFLVKL